MRTVAAARSRAAFRLGFAFLFAVLLAVVVWFATPRGLRPPIDIVGYPSFEDFDYHQQFLAYRLLMWELPIVTLTVWWLLGRAGPFAVEPQPRTPVPLTDAPLPAGVDEETVRPEEPWSLWRYGRLLVTGAVVAVVASTIGDDPRPDLSVTGVLVALAVVGLVLLAAFLLMRATRGFHQRSSRDQWDTALAVAHTYLGATAAVVALVLYTRHSVVRPLEGEAPVGYPWVPWWGAVLAWLATLGALALWARVAPPAAVERAMVRVVGGSVLVYVLLSRMASQVGPIQGFDDMQSVVGADLLSRGYFPWSDFLFIHGLFEDALRSSVGFGLFERSLWGTYAALGMVWIPLTWLGVYWIGIWASRGRAAPLLAVTVLLVWGAVHVGPSYRWVAMSVVWLLLGEAVRRGTWPWTALLTAAMFIEAVLVPEASFQVIGATVVLVGSDLVHRGEGVGRWRALVRTRVFVVTGAGCTVLLCGYLATQGALGAFVNYYLVFGPGHAESGALPIPDLASQIFINVFVVSVFFAGLTLWLGGIWWIRGRPLTSRHWVAFGVALTTALYAEKGLARFDDGHLLQVVTVATPLLAIWVALALSAVDDRVRELIRPEPGPSGRRVAEVRARRFSLASVRQPVSIAVVAILLVTLPSVTETARAAPGHNVSVVGGDRVAGIGWASEDAVDRSMLRDLRTVVDLYTKDGPVFDFTNSPGYFYYLLGEDPPTSYFHVSMAVPEFTQEIVIRELEKSRPALVVFDAPFGLPAWDGPHNQVRHYTLSQYLLDGWTPVLRTNGVLFLARNDLVDDLPDPPELSDGPELSRLHFAAPACDFGYSANFLTSDPTGPELALDVPPPVPVRRLHYAGWAYDTERDRSVSHVVVVAGGVVVASLAATHARVDVAEELDNPGALKSGFYGGSDTQRKGVVALYAVYSDGVAHPLQDAPVRESLNRPGRTPIPVSPEPATGAVDQLLVEEDVPVSTITVPEGTDLPTYRLAQFSSSGGDLGRAEFELSDGNAVLAKRDRRVLFATLPLVGSSIRVRVGACLQWHGYEGDRLYLTQRDPANPVDRLVLSGVTRPYEE